MPFGAQKPRDFQGPGLKIMCLQVSYEKKKNNFFAALKSLKKGAGSGVGSRFVSQRYGFADPDPHQNVMDPQH